MIILNFKFFIVLNLFLNLSYVSLKLEPELSVENGIVEGKISMPVNLLGSVYFRGGFSYNPSDPAFHAGVGADISLPLPKAIKSRVPISDFNVNFDISRYKKWVDDPRANTYPGDIQVGKIIINYRIIIPNDSISK